MRNEILSALKTKFTGVSDNILSRFANKLAETATAGADAQQIADAVTFQDILQSEGDRRANEAAITAVRNYEEKQARKTIKQDETTNDKISYAGARQMGVEAQNGQQDANVTQAADISAMIAKAIAQALPEALSPMQQQIAAMQGEKTAASRRERLNKAISSLPEVQRSRYARDFERMNFADDADFDAYLSELQPDIKAITDDYSRKATVTTPPKNPAVVSADEIKKVNPLITERAQRINADHARQSSPIVGGSAIAPTPASDAK